MEVCEWRCVEYVCLNVCECGGVSVEVCVCRYVQMCAECVWKCLSVEGCRECVYEGVCVEVYV